MGIAEAYYYDVNGSRLPLSPADEVAVDLAAAHEANLPKGALADLTAGAKELRAGVVMLARDRLPSDVADSLQAAGALHPVFGDGGDGLVVVLPEVRIEATDAKQAEEVRRFLESGEVRSEVIRDSADRMVVRPISRGRGADALTLANRVEEAVHPRMAQARFLRVVPRP